MGCGKSSVGARAAQLLGWRFADLDAEIVAAEGMPVVEFFARYGEAEFRRVEVETLKSVFVDAGAEDPAGPGLVLALGGGTLQTPAAAALLKEQGGLAYLEVDGATAWQRARGEGRPLAQDEEAFAKLLTARRKTYESAADWVFPVGDRGVEQVAQELAAAVTMAGGVWASSWGLRLTGTERPSTIIGGAGCLTALRAKSEEAAARGARVFVITDENVEREWGEGVLALVAPASGGEPLVLAAGEQSKTVDSLAACWEWLAARGARRDDIVLALGGGVVGDLAGFAAATYQRGMGLWQVPTSLLAQVDSSVGGKTAIDLTAGKNLAGAFYQPGVVVVDPRTLSTLPDAEFVNGLGEVVKYGLLAGEGLFGSLERERQRIVDRDPAFLSDMIKTCVRYKAAVVSEDERDTGRRAVLNLGHTVAHALEVGVGYGRLRHGEAVGLGLLVALAVSEKELGLDPAVRQRTRALLESLTLPVAIALPNTYVLLAAAGKDKKVVAGSAGFVGLRDIGEPAWKLGLPEGLFEEAMEVIRA
jgi:shikimate kinase/3-dehydroquinate synthase